MKTQRVFQTEGKLEYFSFDIYDKKGRKIGARVRLAECEFVEASEEVNSCYFNIPTGRYFTLAVHAMRDWVTYGPTQQVRYFETRDARWAALGEYLDRAKKRALKLREKLK